MSFEAGFKSFELSKRSMTIHFTHFTVWVFATLSTIAWQPSCCAAGDNGPMRQDPPVPASQSKVEKDLAFLVRIGLPIDGRSAAKAQQSIESILDSNRGLIKAEDRPTVVLEFDMSRGATGQGSSLGACIDLARYLISSNLNRVVTVAYLPGKKQNLAAGDKDKGELAGHAVLVALAANQIAIHPHVKIGSAGIDETVIDEFVAAAYRNLVAKRPSVPVPVAMAMLDKSRPLYRVRTDDGPLYVGARKLKTLEEKGAALATKTLSDVDQPASLTGKQLAEFGLVRSATPSRVDLARQLGVSLDALKSELNQGKPWRAVRVEMPDYIDDAAVQWIIRALEPKVARDEANLIIFDFDSGAGDMDACLRLARKMTAYETNNVRTVAFINNLATGPAALVALSCYHVIMNSDGKIGGEFSPPIPEQKLAKIRLAASGIADSVGRDAALIQAMIDPDLEVFRFRNKLTGEERLMTNVIRDELVDADQWLAQSPIEFVEPIQAEVAEKLRIARQLVSSQDELNAFYQLEGDPELLKPTQIDRWLNQAAMFLASPFVAPWLLFLAMFFLFNEVSQPGLGVPGFLGTVCLILYFWSQHLDGSAHWLEILLFVAGALFLLVELFVLPGFGLFGIGGLIMVVLSIVLASQTFVLIPTTPEEFRQLPKSIFMLSGAFGGVVFAMIALRTVLPNTPYFKKIMLEPPSQGDEGFDADGDSEAMGPWSYLVGQHGVAMTNLVPAGKARIDGQLFDVITEGRLIEKGSKIEVLEVAGNRVVVQLLS